MWRKMFAIGCRRNKLVSPASFNYQSIFSSQFLLLSLLLPLLLSLLLSLLLRLLLSRGNWKFNASSSCSIIDFRSWTFVSHKSQSVDYFVERLIACLLKIQYKCCFPAHDVQFVFCL